MLLRIILVYHNLNIKGLVMIPICINNFVLTKLIA